MKVESLFDDFVSHITCDLSPKTVKTYKERLRLFVENFSGISILDLKKEPLMAFFNSIEGSPDTIRLSMIAFEQFQKWAVTSGHIGFPLIKKFRKPRGKLRTRIPTEDEHRAVLELASDNFRRMYTALRLTGARPSELCKADICNYDDVQSVIVIKEHKTSYLSSRPRKLGVGYRMRDILRVEIDGRSAGEIFRDERGLRWRVNQLSARYRRYRDRAGISKDLVLYSATRHDHGTRVTRKLGIHAAKHSLGHSSITTTMRYDHPEDRELPRYQDSVFDF